MTVAQIEHAETFAERLPTQSTVDRMEQVVTDRRRELILVKYRRTQLRVFNGRHTELDWQISDRRNDLVNQITQSEMRLAENLREFVNVARQIVAEADNGELIHANQTQ